MFAVVKLTIPNYKLLRGAINFNKRGEQQWKGLIA